LGGPGGTGGEPGNAKPSGQPSNARPSGQPKGRRPNGQPDGQPDGGQEGRRPDRKSGRKPNRRSLVEATDRVKDRFGEEAVGYGRELRFRDRDTGTIAQQKDDYKDPLHPQQ
jgi:hypothetical protein